MQDNVKEFAHKRVRVWLGSLFYAFTLVYVCVCVGEKREWLSVCLFTGKCTAALTLCSFDMTHCKWCDGRSIVEIKMAVDGGAGRKMCHVSPWLLAVTEAFWFKRINGSAQGYFSLTGAVRNSPGSIFFVGVLLPLFLLPPLPLTIGGVIRHECLGLQHEWMSSCNAPMTFCHSLLDLLKWRERGERENKIEGKCKNRGLLWNL